MKASSSISVIIPAFNAELYLNDCIKSILGQSLAPMEIILIDDGSTDNTCHIANSYNEVTVLKQNHLGPAAARNKGITFSTGVYLSFIDADDMWTKDHLRKSFEIISQEAELLATMSKLHYIGDLSLEGHELSIKPFFATSLCTMMIHRRAFEQVGLLDESLLLSEDGDWILRFIDQSGYIEMHDYCSVLYRRHRNNITRDKDIRNNNILKVLRNSIERKQGHNGK